MELEITWSRAVSVWWAYLWRNLVAILASMGVGGIIGFTFGLILGSAGVPIQTIQIIVFPISVFIGLAISVVPMKMILGKDFGEFRLVLIENR